MRRSFQSTSASASASASTSASILASAFVLAAISLTAACSGGEIAVGKTEQELKVKKDGGSTGNGSTCSWGGTTAYDTAVSSGTNGATDPGTGTTDPGTSANAGDTANTGNANANPGTGTTTAPPPDASYKVGESFKSLDGCNDCACSTKGIMCTLRACDPGGGSSPPNPGGGTACTDEAKQCPDGSYVGRTGPKCEFSACPGGGTVCDADAQQCPDGSYVGRTGPKCEFVCPEPKACTEEAKQCPDGSYVGRTGPNCEFAPCPK